MAYWLPTVVAVLSGLFSGLGGRRLEAWLFAPKLEVDFNQDERGFRTEARWNEGNCRVHRDLY
jgi:hypothetical protein